MRKEYGKIKGDLRISGGYALHGKVIGDVVVTAGGRFTLHGTVEKGVLIEEGGFAELRGIVLGDVRNKGEVHVFGTIQGGLRDPLGGARIDSDAIIRGTIESPDAGERASESGDS
jgi:hypothetical protein